MGSEPDVCKSDPNGFEPRFFMENIQKAMCASVAAVICCSSELGLVMRHDWVTIARVVRRFLARWSCVPSLLVSSHLFLTSYGSTPVQRGFAPASLQIK